MAGHAVVLACLIFACVSPNHSTAYKPMGLAFPAVRDDQTRLAAVWRPMRGRLRHEMDPTEPRPYEPVRFEIGKRVSAVRALAAQTRSLRVADQLVDRE